MNTVKITFEANGQELKVTSNPALFASNTVDYIEAEFTLGDNWSFQSVRAIWVTDFECIATVLDQNGKCIVPQEVLTKALPVKVNLVGSDVDNNELVDRLTTYPIVALVVNENAKICGTETAPITPSQFEQYIEIVRGLVGTVRDIDRIELTDDYCLVVYFSDGTRSEPIGPIRGATGNGIQSITKINTSGLVDTYQIEYTDGEPTIFTVTNGAKGDTGNGIKKIEKTSTSGLVDTYTITYDNNQTSTFTVTNGAKGDTGNGIDRIELTNTSGAVKTYTIYFTDGNTTTFNVTDGQVTYADLEPLLIKDTVSGDIASFPDGQNVFPLRKCEVTLSPIQDLHGYDKPWVGGAGANKWDEVTYSNGTRLIGTNPIPLVAGQTYYVSAPIAVYIYANGSNLFAGRNNTFTVPSGVTEGQIQFDASYGLVYNHDVSINYPATVTSYRPYSNICPITGWTGCEVVRTGKNLFDKARVTSLYCDGTAKLYGNATFKSVYIPLKPNTSYVFSQTVFGNYDRFALCNSIESGEAIFAPTNKVSGYDSSVPLAFTNTNFKYLVCTIYRSTTDTSTFDQIADSCMLELGSTATPYTPYNGTTYPVSWQTEAGTVYGGTVDLVTGVLTVTDGHVDLGSLSWRTTTASGQVVFTSRDMSGMVNNASRSDDVMCDSYEASTTVTDGTIFTYGSQFIIRNDNYSDADIFATSLSGVYAVYPLATPQTYQLTGQQIACLLGQNNVWSDGEIEVTYVADTGLYILKKLSE